MVSRGLILLALVAVLALPFLLRPRQVALGQADDTLVIITPHNEAIRYEYTEGFRHWYRARTGRTVAIDWRVIGGTSEINRFLARRMPRRFRITGRMSCTGPGVRRWRAPLRTGARGP
ncbi:MAG: hypothetical protein ACHQ4G_07660 [Opitutales bacterium]